MHLLLWGYAAIVATWYLRPFLRAAKEACSEPDSKDGSRGKVSRKRIIPIVFTLLICYMVIGSMHSGKPISEFAFWALMAYIALDTAVITVSQADGFIDKITALKSKTVQREIKETEKTSEVQTG